MAPLDMYGLILKLDNSLLSMFMLNVPSFTKVSDLQGLIQDFVFRGWRDQKNFQGINYQRIS